MPIDPKKYVLATACLCRKGLGASLVGCYTLMGAGISVGKSGMGVEVGGASGIVSEKASMLQEVLFPFISRLLRGL